MEALTAFNESSLLLKVLDLDPERSLAVPVASEAEVGALKLLTPESGDNRCWPETKKNISSTFQVCLYVCLLDSLTEEESGVLLVWFNGWDLAHHFLLKQGLIGYLHPSIEIHSNLLSVLHQPIEILKDAPANFLGIWPHISSQH